MLLLNVAKDWIIDGFLSLPVIHPALHWLHYYILTGGTVVVRSYIGNETGGT